MKVFSVAVAPAIAAIVNLPFTLGWWDNGHMIVGEIAGLLMDPADAATIETVTCKSVASYCASPFTPSFSMMDTWHYIDLPLNVNGDKWKGQDPSVALFADSFDGLSLDFMEKVMTTLATTSSTWAVNLVLCQFIHIFGDSHQPLHTVGGVSADLPGGGGGGNSYVFATPCAHSNLHALWDAAGGEYSLNNRAPNIDDIKPTLRANATELITWLPAISDPLNFDQYKDMPFSAFSAAMTGTNGALKNVILDSYKYANNAVYNGLDLTFNSAKRVPCPATSYTDWVASVAKLRIATAGKRLAVVLTQFARQIRARNLAT
uniref:Uncharacterized protein n=1 Tax=Globisporangium ultimum (strain ATCC 200006 / CBS 805.95 / DAOM BR144) TaxID=431595 RepID=K3WV30_GLOUD